MIVAFGPFAAPTCRADADDVPRTDTPAATTPAAPAPKAGTPAAPAPAVGPPAAPAAAAATQTHTVAKPVAAAAAAPAAARPAAVQYQYAGDPYGFTVWLNATRAAYGLGPVGYDPNLAGWAASNNVQQQARGMGHHVMGPARRQNSAMGNYATIGAMWMNSPAHRAALLDPSITWIGIAGLGAYWTFNAY